MNKEIERNNSLKKRILLIAFGIWYIFFDDMFTNIDNIKNQYNSRDYLLDYIIN